MTFVTQESTDQKGLTVMHACGNFVSISFLWVWHQLGQTHDRHSAAEPVVIRIGSAANSSLQIRHDGDIVANVSGHGRSVLKHQSPAIVPRDLDDSGVKMLPAEKYRRKTPLANAMCRLDMEFATF